MRDLEVQWCIKFETYLNAFNIVFCLESVVNNKSGLAYSRITLKSVSPIIRRPIYVQMFFSVRVENLTCMWTLSLISWTLTQKPVAPLFCCFGTRKRIKRFETTLREEVIFMSPEDPLQKKHRKVFIYLFFFVELRRCVAGISALK